MKGKLFLFVLLAGAAVVALGAAAKAAFTLNSVKVSLPTSEQALPEGPGRSAVQRNCVSCHSSGMILNQPAMSKAAWQAEVAKMRNVYKAEVSDDDAATIVEYLAAIASAK
ncbi:MAG TPA: cytochrome c [Xanthobacteraceae bacterium]|jgi:cytochrome c5